MTLRDTGVKIERLTEVAVSLPLWKTFTYRVPSELEDQIAIGKRVLVPFQRRKITGYVLAFPVPMPECVKPERVKEVIDVLDETALFDETMLEFFRWISSYYYYPLGEVIKTGLPPGLNVETTQFLKITPEGRGRLAQIPLESQDHLILSLTAQEGEISLQRLLQRSKLRNLRSRVFSLKKSQFLTEETRLKKKQIKAKVEPFIVFREGFAMEGNAHLTVKESEILAFIQRRKRVFRRNLHSQFPRVAPYLRRLMEKGAVELDFEEVYRDPFNSEDFGSDRKPILTADQENVLSEIEKSITDGGFSPFLLHGITGSGKTEVYLQVIQQVLEGRKEAIVLVPEISLTPQLISRFKRRFKTGIAILHSGLSPGERYDGWRQILKGEVSIAIGARSAIFAPFRRLGAIIVDEEHETGFKQEEKLKYNARDLAVMRAKMSAVLLILGSATPSVESFFNAKKEKFHYLQLPHRVESRPLPTVEIVDMRLEKGDPRHRIFSERLKEALLINAQKRQQSLLFLNRRGFANFILCRDCGWAFQCPNCSVTLTYHLIHRDLQCHHCSFTTPTPPICPRCKGYNLHPLGIGTQRVEDEILKLIPFARIVRMDRDTTTKKGAYKRIVSAMVSGKIDILIGTQMIVKGHDFPNITLVGIICADTILNFPDFRASERTFQLLTQAAGRAGRGDQAGRVIIQTYNPDHYSIQRARDHDFPRFYQQEIQYRQELQYPPFARLANLRVSGNSNDVTEDFAKRLGKVGAQIKKGRGVYRDHLEILGPCDAPLAKVRGKYRWQLLLKSDHSEILRRFINELVRKTEGETAGVHLDVDVDPINLM
ncbi:MAG: primosomal protein N' [Proteobacteria bacterium]|nr:primosomal protein N' [Pseudomonadota bacterium]NIS68829.1 primosomal protein N' [Pseudomonadota bacterium]